MATEETGPPLADRVPGSGGGWRSRDRLPHGARRVVRAANTPPFNPPDWIFGPVWTALYVLIAVAGWRLWRQHRAGVAMRLWRGQLALNFLWSPIFFLAHQIALALVVVSALLVGIAWFIAAARRVDVVAMWCFVPYAAWVGFATVLNAAILVLNEHQARERSTGGLPVGGAWSPLERPDHFRRDPAPIEATRLRRHAPAVHETLNQRRIALASATPRRRVALDHRRVHEAVSNTARDASRRYASAAVPPCGRR